MLKSKFYFLCLGLLLFFSTSCTPSLFSSEPRTTSIPLSIPTPTSVPSPTLDPTIESRTDVTSDVIDESASTTSQRQSIIVGSKEFTEQLLLGKMLVLALQEAGYEVIDQTGFGGTRLVREAIEEGEIDLYWELSGAALTLIHGFPAAALPTEPNRAYQLAKSKDQQQGLIWLERLEVNDTYTLVVSEETWNEGITTLEQLADFMNANDAPYRICLESEFLGRPDGLPGLQEHYGFSFKEENIEILAVQEIYEYLQAGKCEVAEVFSTDGRIAAWELYRLADTRSFFPFYNPAPVIRQATLEQHPDLGEFLAGLLSTLVPRLDETTMSQLNACVDIGSDGLPETGDEMSVEEVASAFLRQEGLACLPRSIVVGSTTSAEQVLLSKMLILWLKESGYEVVDQTALGDTLAVREALRANKIDVQWEIINNALTLFYGLVPESLPQDPNQALTLIKDLEQELGFVWLERIRNVNATFSLMVKPETYEEGITNLAALADFMNENDSSFKLCAQEAFYHRPDGLTGMEERYGFQFQQGNILLLDTRGIYDGLRDGRCEVAQALTTGSHEAYGFELLEDSERVFLPFVPAPIIRQQLLREQPELAELLNTIGFYLDGGSLEILNSRIQIGADGIPSSGDEESAETAALGFLCAVGLLEDCPELAIGRPVEDEIESVALAPGCEQLVLNGQFEKNTDWTFPSTPRPADYSSDVVHSGTGALRLGVNHPLDDFVGHSVAHQRITIPEGVESAKLSYWYYPRSNRLNGDDYQGALIYNGDLSFIERGLMRTLSNEQAWSFQEHDLSNFIGQEITLYFYVVNDGDGFPSVMYLDDVNLQVCQ